MMRLEPLIVSLSFRTPVAAPRRRPVYPLHLDALVISLLARRNKSGQALHVGEYDPKEDPYAPERAAGVTVPLAAAGAKVPVYQASAAAVCGEMNYTRIGWVKKSPEVPGLGLLSSRSTIIVAGKDESKGGGGWGAPQVGEYAAVLPLEGRSPMGVIFTCVGNKEMLEDILSDLVGIGPCRQIGYGEVLKVKVEAVRVRDIRMWGLTMFHEGREMPARMLPVEDWPGGEEKGWRLTVAALRPPYWHPVNRGFCWEPPARMYLPTAATAAFCSSS